MRNTSCDVTLNQRGCGHGGASFHHDIISKCPWPSSSLVEYLSSETDGKIAS